MARALSQIGQRLEARSQYANSLPRTALQSLGKTKAIYHVRVSVQRLSNPRTSTLTEQDGSSSFLNYSTATVLKP